MPYETVLIIEDDPTLLLGLRDNFESAGFTVQTAVDGEAGLEAAQTGAADLILLDIMLPKVNGYEICRLLRQGGLDTPIIMLTAKGQEDDIVRGLNLGADDYLTKPFSIRELLARANAFIRRRSSGPAKVHRFGECELDLESHRLYRKGEEVVLTPKEFQLLEYFAQRSGRALTRDDIMHSVWGSSVIVTARSVDRCVTTLRGKIEPDPRNPTHIQTIRDIGYRFEADAPAPAAKASSPGSNVHGTDDDFVALRPGDCLGRYEIRSLLGRGGMAEVYKALDSRLGREVAVKVLSRRLARNNDALMRFERETKAIAALSHPNIVAIFDVTQDGEVYFAVMELLEGESLKERLSRGPIPWSETRRMALSVAEGLAAVHAMGVVHRDIKPGNIFLTTANVTKLLDFGLARMDTNPPAARSDDNSTFTQHTMIGTVMGTTNYMSPEQVRGQLADARSDVFSFGAVLYEMITGRRPFQRETPADTMAAILKDPPPPLSEVATAAPPALADLLQQCLQKNPSERFPTADALADALRPLS